MEIRYLFALQWNWIFEEAINIGLICGIVNCVDGKYVWQIKDLNWIVRHSTDSSAITGKRQAAKSTKDDLLRDCLLSSTMHLPNSQFSSIPFGALHISCCCSSDKYPNTRDKKKRSKMKDQITICCHSIMGQTSNKSLSDGSANPNPDTNFEPWTRGTKTKKKTTNTNRIGFLLRTASVWQPDQGLISPIGASAFVMGISRYWMAGVVGLDPATIAIPQCRIHSQPLPGIVVINYTSIVAQVEALAIGDEQFLGRCTWKYSRLLTSRYKTCIF